MLIIGYQAQFYYDLILSARFSHRDKQIQLIKQSREIIIEPYRPLKRKWLAATMNGLLREKSLMQIDRHWYVLPSVHWNFWFWFWHLQIHIEYCVGNCAKITKYVYEYEQRQLYVSTRYDAYSTTMTFYFHYQCVPMSHPYVYVCKRKTSFQTHWRLTRWVYCQTNKLTSRTIGKTYFIFLFLFSFDYSEIRSFALHVSTLMQEKSKKSTIKRENCWRIESVILIFWLVFYVRSKICRSTGTAIGGREKVADK